MAENPDENPGDFPDGLPPAMEVDPGDLGSCEDCGAPTFRPPGQTPSGRKRRIPKRCEACAHAKTPARRSGTHRRRRGIDIESGMTELYTSVGLLVATRDLELGQLIVGPQRMKELLESGAGGDLSVAADAGRAWSNVASSNPAVATVLGRMLETGVWAELANAHIPLLAVAAQRRPTIVSRVRAYLTARRAGRA